MRQVIGIGETILDIIFKGSSPHAAVPGGSVFNTLVSLRRMQVPVVFISEAGNDRVGDLIVRFMSDNRLSTRYIDRFSDGKSPVSIAFLDEQNNADYAFYKDYPARRLDTPLPPVGEDDIFIFGSYYALDPALRERIVEFVEYARERKAIVYYDPNFRKPHAHQAIRLMPTVLENFEYADIVRGSDEDFHNLFGHADTEKIYADRVRYYCRNFLVTHGARGTSLYCGDEAKHFDAPPLEPVSAIGAGDNFNAGLIYGLLKYNIRYQDLAAMTPEKWEPIVRCGIDFSAEVCRSYANTVSPEFAEKYSTYLK